MAKIIVTSRYLKSGSKGNLSNYVKYIATRPGSVSNSSNREIKPVTDNQKQFIEKLLKDFPEGKEMFEYDDYISKPSEVTASKLIGEIIERNSDRIANRKNFVGYLGKRPGVVKLGEHGLFSQEDKPIDLKAVAKEISAHKGNVWTHVVALRRDNAEKTGYTDLNSWRELVKRNIPKIAEASKIDMKNLKWYAAFHDKETNPHVHIIVYSTDPREGFLTNKGIEKIRSAFANDIYHDELYNLYGRQTALRDDLKKESAKLMHKLAENIRTGNSVTNDLIKSVAKLSEQLSNCKGKLYYKYLPPEVKKTVDDIFSQLAGNESIQKMYELWCEMEQQKHDIYSSAKVNFPPMTENKTFVSVRNMIIKTVSEFETVPSEPANFYPPEPSDDGSGDDYSFEIDTEPLTNPVEYPHDITPVTGNYYINWSKEYKAACKLIYAKESGNDDFDKAEKLLLSEAGKGNVLALFDLGRFYTAEKFERKDDSRSESYYADALKGFMQLQGKDEYEKLHAYICYRIGKMYCYGLGTAKDEAEAFKWFEKSAVAGNKFAQFSIGNCYYYGSGIEQNYEKAFRWYKASAEQGQPYAQYALAQMYSRGEAVLKDDAKAKEYYEKALAGFKGIEASGQADDNLLYKIGQMYKQGLGTDTDTKTALDYFRRAAELNNKNAQRTMALEYISGGNIEQDIDKGIEMLTELADGGDNLAAYKLGRIYLAGEVVFKDVGKAEKYLQQAAGGGNEFAMYALAKLYLMDEKKDISKAAQLLEKTCDFETIKPYAAYTYAKLLTDDNKFRDSEKAISLLEETAEDNNWCSFLLGQIYAYGKGGIARDKEKAVVWLARSADAGNEYAGALLQHIDDYEQSQLVDSIFGLFVNLSRLIEDDYSRSQRGVEAQVDRKLRKVMDQKKAELGIKADGNIHFDY